MKKFKFKRIFAFLALCLIVVTSLTSCTKSFCSVKDNTQNMYAAEKWSEGKTFKDGEKTKAIENSAASSGMLVPNSKFYTFMETKIEAKATELATIYSGLDKYKDQVGEDKLYNTNYFRGLALFGGYDGTDVDNQTLWKNYDSWLAEARTSEDVGLANCPDNNYVTLYKSTFNSIVSSTTTCISPKSQSYNGVVIEGKSWGDAFGKGLIEGLLVYPVSWLIYTFSTAFASLGGFGAVLAIFFVTLIIRTILIACTFKPTMAQQKMTALQPELQKIQAKYPNSQTNQYEKQKLAQEQMALYKKNKINPFSMFIVLIFQFPIFIAVWGAMQGSAILMSGNLFSLELAATTSTAMFNFSGQPWNATFTAWVIFILMAIAQAASMLIPQMIQKKKQKALSAGTKLGKNPSQDQQAKTMKIMQIVMLVMIIVMGLRLPIAMSIYWFVTALISLGQSFVTQAIIEKSRQRKNNNVKIKKA